MRVFEIPNAPGAGRPGIAPRASSCRVAARRVIGTPARLAALGAVLTLSVWPSGTTVPPADTMAHGPGAGSPSVPGAPARGVRVVDGLLAIDALELDVAELLAEVARQAGFEFDSSMTAPDRISLRFDLLPLEQGLLLILSGQSYSLAWVDPNAVPGTRRPHRVWLFDAQAEPVAPRTATTAAITTPTTARATTWLDPADLLAALRTGTPLEREQAAADLGHVSRDGGAAAGASEASSLTQVLAAALSDPDEAVRQAAIESLGVIGGDSAALALELALHDPQPRVRESAVDALSDIGGPTALALLERSRNDSVEYVREAAREAIGRARAGELSRSRRD